MSGQFAAITCAYSRQGTPLVILLPHYSLQSFMTGHGSRLSNNWFYLPDDWLQRHHHYDYDGNHETERPSEIERAPFRNALLAHIHMLTGQEPRLADEMSDEGVMESAIYQN